MFNKCISIISYSRQWLEAKLANMLSRGGDAHTTSFSWYWHLTLIVEYVWVSSAAFTFNNYYNKPKWFIYVRSWFRLPKFDFVGNIKISASRLSSHLRESTKTITSSSHVRVPCAIDRRNIQKGTKIGFNFSYYLWFLISSESLPISF